MTLTRLLSFLTIVLLTLVACQSGPTLWPEATIDTIPAEESGNLKQAAAEYMAMGDAADLSTQPLYYLRAASLYYQLEQFDNSRQALDKVAVGRLSVAQHTEAATLSADLYLQQKQADKALDALSQVDLSAASNHDKAQLLSREAAAYGLQEEWLAQVNAYLKADQLFSDEAELTANRESLWQSLMHLSAQELDRANPGTPPRDSGWFALAYAIKAYQNNPEAQEVALEDWRLQYPNHPADPALYQGAVTIPLSEDMADITVLLPSSGKFANVATAIRDGIVAAHDSSAHNSQLSFIDTSSSNVVEAYNNAYRQGADLVIGPLEKTAVDALAKADNLPVPVLALNHTSNNASHANLYQYGLVPEDDVASIIEYARRQNFQNAVILAPLNDFGNRLANHFSQTWEQAGGTIISRSGYREEDNDFRHVLVPLLGLQEHHGQPQPRSDIDFIFLVAKPLKARQLVTQLRFHHSGSLPILATSHAYAGSVDTKQDIDLEGLIIPDISWFLTENNQDPAYLALQEDQDAGSLLRLYAMGADAYRLVSELNRLRCDSSAVYHGASGELTLDAQGQVDRHMRWGQFRGGVLTPLN